MNKRKLLCYPLKVAIVSCGLAACDGSEMGGNQSSDNSQQNSSVSGNQPLADLTFADTGLAECVMATGKAMSDEVTELTCPQTISDLTGIGQLQKLESFEPQALAMQVADFSEIPQLKKLILGGSNSANNQMQLMDLSANIALEELWLVDIDFTDVNLTANRNLTSLNLYGTPVETLDLSNLPQLKRLHISSATKLSDIVLSSLGKLEYLRFSSGQIDHIDISNNPKLEYLYLYANQLTELDLSKNPALLDLDVNCNKIENIIWGNNEHLKKINFENNLINSLDLTGLDELNYLNIAFNPLTTLNVTNNAMLGVLKASRTQLSYVDLTQNVNLGNLDLGFSNINCEEAKLIKAEMARPETLNVSYYGENCTE